MAPIIQILLTLTCVVLGDCHLDLLARQLLGLAPTVGPLLPQRNYPLDILHSIIQRHQDHLRPLNQNGFQIHTYNINSDQKYNPLWSLNDGSNPIFESGPFNTRGFDAPSGFGRFDVSQIYSNVPGGYIDQTQSLNGLHTSIDDKKPQEYPDFTLCDITSIDDVGSLVTDNNVPNIDEDLNIKSAPYSKEIHETLPSKTNTIQRSDDPNNGNKGDGLNARKFLLISPNNNGNNIYLLQDIGNTNTPHSITLPISANQQINHEVYVPSPSIQNNQLYELIHGILKPISIVPTNQNNPYSSTQMNLPAVNQNPSYVLVYNNGQNGNAGQDTNVASNSFQNVPVTSQILRANTVYLDTPNQEQYVGNGHVPNVIAIPNTVIPQSYNQAASGNVEPNNNNIAKYQQVTASANPICCQDDVAQTDKEAYISKELATGSDTVATANEVGNPTTNQPPVMTPNGLTSQNIQPALMISYKENTDKYKANVKNDER